MLGHRRRRWPNCNPACTVLAHAGTAKTSVETSGRQTRIDDVICPCTRRLRRRVIILWEHCRIGKHTCAPTDPDRTFTQSHPTFWDVMLSNQTSMVGRVMGWCRGDNGPSPGNVVGWCFVYYSSFKPQQALTQCRFKTETLSVTLAQPYIIWFDDCQSYWKEWYLLCFFLYTATVHSVHSSLTKIKLN